jgi:hypothetical protein
MCLSGWNWPSCTRWSRCTPLVSKWFDATWAWWRRMPNGLSWRRNHPNWHSPYSRNSPKTSRASNLHLRYSIANLRTLKFDWSPNPKSLIFHTYAGTHSVNTRHFDMILIQFNFCPYLFFIWFFLLLSQIYKWRGPIKFLFKFVLGELNKFFLDY